MIKKQFRRTSLADDATTMNAIFNALQNMKRVKVDPPSTPIKAVRKGRSLKNEGKMELTIASTNGQIIAEIYGMGTGHATFANEIFDALPTDMVDDQGITPAIEEMEKYSKRFIKGELRTLHDDLQPNERVVIMSSGTIDNSPGLLVITDKRVLLKDKALGGSMTKEIYPQQITSIGTGKNMGGETIELQVSGAKVRIGGMPHGRGERVANVLRRMKDNTSTAASVDTPSSDVDELKKLAELHASGVLTDEEFAAAKARILGI